MNLKSIFIRQSPIKAPLKELLTELNPNSHIQQHTKNILTLTVNKIEDADDYQEIHALLKSDFDEDVALIEIDHASLNIVSETIIIEFLERLNPEYYDIALFMRWLILESKENADFLRRRLLTCLSQPLIDMAVYLAEANMNVSHAAKKAHMHRNTFMYRMEIIKQKSGLDLTNFYHLSVITALFN